MQVYQYQNWMLSNNQTATNAIETIGEATYQNKKFRYTISKEDNRYTEDNVKAIREMQIKICNVINNTISNDPGNSGIGLRETLKVTNDPYFKEFQ